MESALRRVDDLTRARRLPSPQLVGTPERATLDLNALTDLGVELVGRLSAVRDGRALFSGGLRNCSRSPISRWGACSTRSTNGRAPRTRADGARPNASRHARAAVLSPADRSAQRRLRTIVWATGFRPDYSWLQVPVVDEKGHLRHVGGVVESPGMYALGLPVLRRRKSTFIHGIEDDARDVTAHLAVFLGSASSTIS